LTSTDPAVDSPVDSPTADALVTVAEESKLNAIGQSLPVMDYALQSLEHLLDWHTRYHAPLQPELQPQLDQLAGLVSKLKQGLIQIAAFGLVSRGKSTVLNALYGEKVFQTGPLNGVTQWPRSLRLNWSDPDSGSGIRQIELTDTPGLDEVAGQDRADLAKAISEQADLILFITTSELTETEKAALTELCSTQKPLLWVINKSDLHPDLDVREVLQTLDQPQQQQLLATDAIVSTAAAPLPVQVRLEWPDGRSTYRWETPPAQTEALQAKLNALLQREGAHWVAVHALMQAETVEQAIAAHIMEQSETVANELIWKFVRAKALAVALNPIALLDLLGGSLADLMLIRALARFYGLPLTGYQAGKLLKTIWSSAGGLLLGQVVGSLALGMGKTTTLFQEGLGGLSTFAGTVAMQAAIAGYGAYAVGQAAQIYLSQGCSWGVLGPSQVIQNILSNLDPETVLYHLHQDLS
jgi:hypothetical protein